MKNMFAVAFVWCFFVFSSSSVAGTYELIQNIQGAETSNFGDRCAAAWSGLTSLIFGNTADEGARGAWRFMMVAAKTALGADRVSQDEFDLAGQKIGIALGQALSEANLHELEEKRTELQKLLDYGEAARTGKGDEVRRAILAFDEKIAAARSAPKTVLDFNSNGLRMENTSLRSRILSSVEKSYYALPSDLTLDQKILLLAAWLNGTDRLKTEVPETVRNALVMSNEWTNFCNTLDYMAVRWLLEIGTPEAIAVAAIEMGNTDSYLDNGAYIGRLGPAVKRLFQELVSGNTNTNLVQGLQLAKDAAEKQKTILQRQLPKALANRDDSNDGYWEWRRVSDGIEKLGKTIQALVSVY